MNVEMFVAGLAVMRVLFRFHFDRHHDKAPMAYAALGNDVIGEMADLAGVAPEDRDFETASVV